MQGASGMARGATGGYTAADVFHQAPDVPSSDSHAAH